VKAFTVLIVEDDESVRASFADMLRLRDYNIIEAGDGIKAVELLSMESIDLLLLDLRLPRLDGPEVLDALDAPLPVIVVSAFEYFDEDEMRERFGSKVFAFLRKPVAPGRLLDVVADALRGTDSEDRA